MCTRAAVAQREIYLGVLTLAYLLAHATIAIRFDTVLDHIKFDYVTSTFIQFTA